MSNSLIIGTTLQDGKYRIDGILGQGGFGITYLATQTIIGKQVAIKEFFFKEYCKRCDSSKNVTVPTSPQKEMVSRLEKKFLKEAKIILALNHPNIIRVFDVFQENNTSYYAMEYIKGASLSDRIVQRGPLSEIEALGIIERIGDALSYLHNKHINHLDVKPSNIMLDPNNNRVVLIDFGVSKQYDPVSGDGTTTTPAGISHGYSPIEQYNAGGVGTFSPQSDIYSLGATLFKMITGITPPSAIDLSQRQIQIPSNISDAVAKGIIRAMQPLKKERPRSVEDFLSILKGTDETTVSVQTNIPPKKHAKAYGITAFVLGCIFIGVIIFISSGNSSGTAFHSTSYTEDAGTNEDNIAHLSKTIQTRRYMKETPSPYDEKNIIDYDYPTSGNTILLQNIREWINEQLGGTYDGDLSKADAMFNHYCVEMSSDATNQVRIRKLYENDKIVTYKTESFMYVGGAHGLGYEVGTTFRKSDGKIFTKEMFQNFYEIQPYIKKGLKKHFQVSSDNELMENLQLSSSLNDIDNLPIPETNPWITGKEVIFSYRSYEIACYAAGEPTFTIPNREVKKFLTATGKTFFE